MMLRFSRDVVIYDGQCAFCRTQIDRMQRRDREHVFEFVPIETPGLDRLYPVLTQGDFNTGMRLVTLDGSVFVGADAVYQISRRLSGWRWVAWLYRLPVVGMVARQAYAWIAANRHRLGGECEDGACRIQLPSVPDRASGSSGEDQFDASRVSNGRFQLFSFLYALAILAYYAQIWHAFGANLATLTVVVAAVVLWRPGSIAGFLVLTGSQVLSALSELQAVNTNRLLLLFAGGTILVIWVDAVVTGRRLRIPGEELMARLEPVLRVELLVVYFFSFWHKLNRDFLDPQLSCGTALFAQLQRAVPILPPPPADVAALSIYATLVLEAGIPLLLIVRRTRALGVVVGWLFHFILGVGGFYSFSATMMALLLLYAPPTLSERLAEQWPRLSLWRSDAWRPIGGTIWGVAGVLLAIWYVTHREPSDSMVIDAARLWRYGLDPVFWHVFWLYLFPLAAFAYLMRTGTESIPLSELLVGPHRRYLVLPLVLVVNGLSPYLGLKTETSFAMYSNLRTEGGESNHLVMRRPFYIAPYQADLVRIVETSDPYLQQFANAQRPLPFIQLRIYTNWLASLGGHTSLTYARAGVTKSVTAVETDAELSARVHPLEARLLTFRDIQRTCAH